MKENKKAKQKVTVLRLKKMKSDQEKMFWGYEEKMKFNGNENFTGYERRKKNEIKERTNDKSYDAKNKE